MTYKELQLQVENFVSYFGRLNPHQSLRKAFDFWVETKDFNEDEKEILWGRIGGI